MLAFRAPKFFPFSQSFPGFFPEFPLTVRGVHAQVDGHGGDALVGARHPVGLRLDLLPHLVEIREFLGFAVQELGIFWKGWGTLEAGSVWQCQGRTGTGDPDGCLGNVEEGLEDMEKAPWIPICPRKRDFDSSGAADGATSFLLSSAGAEGKPQPCLALPPLPGLGSSRTPHPDTASLIPQPLSTIPEPSSIRPITQSLALPNPPSAPGNHNGSRRSPEAPGLTRIQGFFGKRLVQGKGMKKFSPDIRKAGVKQGNLVGKMSQPRAQLSIPRFSLAFLRPPQHSQAFPELSPAFSHDKQGNGPERVTREGCCVQTPTVPPGIDSRFSNPVPVLEKMSCRMRGRRVTIPEPRGRKSLEGMKTWVNK